MLPTIKLSDVRRLAIHRQGLAERRFPDLLTALRGLNCVQIDPINVVARTQHLVLYSRLGSAYSPDDLHRLAYDDKHVFHYWAHAASLVLTEDLPIHRNRMHRWPSGGPWTERVNLWMKENAAFRRYILREIDKRGPLRARDLEDRTVRPWRSTGWTHNQNVSRMLEFMWTKGEITVAGRSGLDRVWDRAARWFPEWAPTERLSDRKTTELAALRAVRSLGAATANQVAQHFIRDGYTDLRARLSGLVKKGALLEVDVENDGTKLRGPWYIHPEDLGWIEGGHFEGRTVPLSPFDNLICDRKRTKLLFGVDFTIEIYVPAAKRRYGYYVLPILDGDRIAALIDPKMDRKNSVLTIERLHVLNGTSRQKLKAITKSIEDLGSWLGASEIRLPAPETLA